MRKANTLLAVMAVHMAAFAAKASSGVISIPLSLSSLMAKHIKCSVTAERTITGNMIDRNDFQEFLINQLPESDRGFMKVFSDANITFLADNNSTINDSTLLPIRIKGSFKARAEFDEVAIRASLARQKKTDAKTLLKNIPGVISAEINLFPPWARRLPEKISAFVFKTTYQ